MYPVRKSMDNISIKKAITNPINEYGSTKLSGFIF